MFKNRLKWRHCRAIAFVLLVLVALLKPSFTGIVAAIVILALMLKWLLAHLKKRLGL